MNLEENLNKILSKYDELQKKAASDEIINSPKDYAVVSKEISEILPTVELIKKFKKIKEEIKIIKKQLQKKQRIESLQQNKCGEFHISNIRKFLK